MKKTITILLLLFFCCGMLAGCGGASEKSLAVYSFYGENEIFAIQNGVIVLSRSGDILSGGIASEKLGQLTDTVGYTLTFYVQSGDEKIVFLSNSVVDGSGTETPVSGPAGKMYDRSRPISAHADELPDNLYCDLEITNAAGETSTYPLHLTVEEVTA